MRGTGTPTGAIEQAPSRVDENSEENIVKALLESFPNSIIDYKRVKPGTIRVRIDRHELFKVSRFIHEKLGFEHMSMISAVDYEDRFEIVYHITCYGSCMLMELITQTPKDDPSVDSVSSIWGGANWQEREAYDLMGVKFNNHPQLERILLPKDYLYHPLRKDFKG